MDEKIGTNTTLYVAKEDCIQTIQSNSEQLCNLNFVTKLGEGPYFV